MIALKDPETDLDLYNGEEASGKQSSTERGVSEEKGEKGEKGESSSKSPSSSAVKSAKKGTEVKAEVKNGKEEEKKVEEEKEIEEEEEEAEEEEKVVLRIDKTLTWFYPPVPQNRTSYTPVHLGPLLTATTSASAPSSSSSAEERFDSGAVRDVLSGSIDAVRNEVLEVLTRTIYSVARSMRPDPVSSLCRTVQCSAVQRNAVSCCVSCRTTSNDSFNSFA